MRDGTATGDALEALRARVDGREWYHTLELAPGVVTPGFFDTIGIRHQERQAARQARRQG